MINQNQTSSYENVLLYYFIKLCQRKKKKISAVYSESTDLRLEYQYQYQCQFYIYSSFLPSSGEGHLLHHTLWNLDVLHGNHLCQLVKTVHILDLIHELNTAGGTRELQRNHGCSQTSNLLIHCMF